VAELTPAVEWVPICPEVEAGMGVPREPIQLVRHAEGVRSRDEVVRLTGVHTGADWTDRMRRWSSVRLDDLVTIGISGFVLKARSPSCGPAAVLVHDVRHVPTPTGRGLFAEALAAKMPGLPVMDEEALEDPHARERFLQDVRICAASLRGWQRGHQ
jgi:uncharacterized protein YbbK (DUF523 family)